MPISDDCASSLHDYCNLCSCMCHGVVIDPDGAVALWKFLMHEYLPHEDEKLNEAVRAIGRYVREYSRAAQIK